MNTKICKKSHFAHINIFSLCQNVILNVCCPLEDFLFFGALRVLPAVTRLTVYRRLSVRRRGHIWLFLSIWSRMPAGRFLCHSAKILLQISKFGAQHSPLTFTQVGPLVRNFVSTQMHFSKVCNPYLTLKSNLSWNSYSLATLYMCDEPNKCV